jgi:hypothetical protein
MFLKLFFVPASFLQCNYHEGRERGGGREREREREGGGLPSHSFIGSVSHTGRFSGPRNSPASRHSLGHTISLMSIHVSLSLGTSSSRTHNPNNLRHKNGLKCCWHSEVEPMRSNPLKNLLAVSSVSCWSTVADIVMVGGVGSPVRHASRDANSSLHAMPVYGTVSEQSLLPLSNESFWGGRTTVSGVTSILQYYTSIILREPCSSSPWEKAFTHMKWLIARPVLPTVELLLPLQ